jgi:hypothetical protein
MRRLVYASVAQGDLKTLSFPGGDEVQRPGYDGITETAVGTEKVPGGIAYWEMGTDAKVKAKLDGDFNKRIKKRGKGDFSQVTYIAITPRDYTPKTKWAAQKTKLKKWKKVLVYDSDDLEQWLETVPSVALWLTRYVSLKRPEGIEDLSTHWDNLQSSLKSKVPPAALLVSRQGTVERFKQWLAGTPELLTVHGQTPQEVVDVFAAWVASLNQSEQEPIASRVIIVEQIESWRALVDTKQHLILICSERVDVTPELLAEALRKGHHVLRPISSLHVQSADVLRLERMNRHELEKALREAGITEHEAFSLSQQSGGSFSVLKRRLSRIPFQTAPKWGNPTERDQLAPLLLAGAWSDENKDDQKIVAALAKQSYEKAREIANRWQHESDAPIWWAGGVWEFIAPLDAWMFLHPALSPAILDRFEKAAIKVLGIDDPRLELSPDERFLAAVTCPVRLDTAGLGFQAV